MLVLSERKLYGSHGVSRPDLGRKGNIMRTEKLRISYKLTTAAHKTLNLTAPTDISQDVTVEIPLEEMLARGVATLRTDGTASISGARLYSDMRYAERYGEVYCTGNTESEYDHVLTPDEALSEWRAMTARAEATRPAADAAAAKTAAAMAAKKEEDAAKVAADKALKLKIATEFLAGSKDHKWHKGDGTAYSTLNGIAVCWFPVDLQDELMAEIKRRADAQVTAWVAEHGSERLRKIVRAGLLGSSLSVYRDERLAVEMGAGWEWDSDDYIDSDALNPTDAVVDRLLSVKEKFPAAELLRTRTKADAMDDPYADNDDDGDGWVWTIRVSPGGWTKRNAILRLTDLD